MVSRIVAMSGPGFGQTGKLGPLDRYLLSLAGKERPRVCFLGTALGDPDRYAANFYRAYTPVAEATDLVLFGTPRRDAIERLVDQDIVYVGGGNTANMLAVWRVHGVDEALRQAWEGGTVLTGVSAGAICWFEACLTDSFGTQLAALHDGLALLPGSACTHVDSEEMRHPRYVEEIGAGHLPDGYGIEDGAAVMFEGPELAAVVTELRGKGASRFELRDADVRETQLPATLLTEGSEDPAPPPR